MNENVINIQDRWFIDDSAKSDLKEVWFHIRKILEIDDNKITNTVIFEKKKEKMYIGISFWMVSRIKIENHDIVFTICGTHINRGNIPNLIDIDILII